MQSPVKWFPLFTLILLHFFSKLQHGGGSGLGLCISKEIVEHHGGKIQAFSSGPGEGAMFVIQLPLYKILSDGVGDASLNIQASIGDTNGNAETAANSHHILVVDDSISNTKMLVRLLKRAGHTCSVARDGQQAIDKYQKENGSFDTILMDYEMPVLNGPEATKRLRNMGCTSLIFGITGNVLAEDVAFFKASGANQVLPKPVSMGAIDACWAKADHRHHNEPPLIEENNAA